MASSAPTELQVAAVILSLITVLIGTHKFVIQRPRIQLKAEREEDFLFPNGVKSHVNFVVVNKGFQFAEDTYLEVRLPDWNFGEQRRRIDWNISVSVADPDRNDSTEDEDNDEPEGEDSEESEEESSEDVVRAVESALNVRHDLDTYFLSSGEVNHLFIEDTLYKGTEFTIFYGELLLEQFETYQLEYSVGCRSYSPRKGRIEFNVGYDEIEINHIPPRFWRSWYAYINDIGHDLRNFVQSQIRSLLGVDLSKQEVRLIYSDIEQENRSDSGVTILPVAGVRLREKLNERRSVKVKGLLYLEQAGEEKILGTATFNAYSLDPGEFWETRLPQDQWKTNRFKYNVEYERGPLQGALPIEIHTPEDAESQPTVHVDWSVDSWAPREGNLRGLSLKNCTFDEELSAAKGTLQNTSSVDVTVFVIAKLYTAGNRLLATPYSSITVEAKSEEEFTIPSDLSPDQNERLSSCKCVLSNAL